MWCKQLACLQAAATMPCLCTQHAPSEGVSGLKASFVCLQALLRRTALPQSAWTGPTLTALWPLCPWMKGMRVWPPHLGRTTRPEWVRCRTELLPSRIRTWTKPSLLSGEGGSILHAWSCLCRHMMATGCSAYRRVQCLTVWLWSMLGLYVYVQCMQVQIGALFSIHPWCSICGARHGVHACIRGAAAPEVPPLAAAALRRLGLRIMLLSANVCSDGRQANSQHSTADKHGGLSSSTLTCL